MKYTTDELAVRLWDTEHVRHTMNLMCYYISNGDFRGCLSDLWVRQNKRTASLGVNTGFYTGMDEIERYLVLDNAELPWDKTGYARMTTLTTPLIKIHGDGKTAQYQGYMPGFQSFGRDDGTWTPT